ncbi:DUF4424 domain-containing protein [Ancylobacter sp. 6x-1]|uniref:DUF4424 domain-containing protein n=1 Tax=Ancylobacter crimeensis TaxID=2579147 RepID=A0ABT0D7L1_9HYPH|nr:DUF4424 domain-containing protein [Ancylobacter crimeensis]
MTVLATLATVTVPAAAEGAEPLTAGGIAFTVNAGITIKTESVRISVAEITIDYEFVNETGADLVTLLAFPLPTLGSGDPSIADSLPRGQDPVNFLAATTTIDGKPVQPQVAQRASVLGVDITDRLRADGVPLNPYAAPAGRAALAALPAPKRAFYLQNGLAQWSGNDPVSFGWDVATSLYWLQTFPAGKTVKVHHRYIPVSGSGLLGLADLDAAPAGGVLSRNYCLDEGGIAGIRKALSGQQDRNPLPTAMLQRATLGYRLGMGAGWSAPVGLFKLTVEKPKPDDIMSMCFGGKLDKASPTSFTFTARNYLPQDDLAVLFVSTGTR